MGYLLSIVVPTKNRYYYLKSLIKLIQSFNSNEIELVIQDNTENNFEILEYLKSINFKHLKYFHIKQSISIALNADYAILNSSGKYVCFIGDDDGVTRFILDAVKWMESNDIDIIKSSFAIYKWPSFKSNRYYNVSAALLDKKYSYKVNYVNSHDCLMRSLTEGMNSLQYLPKVYNGIVKRKTLDDIYNICKTYFPGPSPDMANAIALCLVSNKYVFIDAPIIIGGHSVHLGGDANRYKLNYGPLDEQPFISQKDKDEWHHKVPKVWSSTTVWPQSVVTALLAFNKKELIEKINFEKSLATFAVQNPSIKSMAYERTNNFKKLSSEIRKLKLKRCIRGAINLLSYYLFNRYDKLYINRNVKSIIEAEKLLCLKNKSNFYEKNRCK